MTLQEWCKKNNKENLLKEWDYEKNKDVTPDAVICNSKYKAWWKCDKGHSWSTTIKTKIYKKGTCPYCSGRFIIKGINDLQTVNPDLIKEWNYEKNIGLLPSDFSPNSGKKVWWKCKHGHEWTATIYGRNKNQGCPYCANQKILKGDNDLTTLYPVIAKEWNYEKNNKLNLFPDKISAGSSKNVWWKCQFGHEWQTTVNNRTRKNTNCPYCSGKRTLPGFNDLQTKYPNICKEWNYDKNNNLTPDLVTAYSNAKVWWKCQFGHEWLASIYNRTKQNSNCPYCSGRFAIKNVNDITITNPELLSEWDYDKNTVNPTEILPHSDKKVWWKCKLEHEWLATVKSRTSGTGCPICIKERKTSFPEQALFFYIKKYYSDAINSNKDIIGIELDIYIPSLKIAIEYDGVAWHKNNKSEQKKNKLCKDNNIYLIRIREEGLKLYDDCCCIIRKNVESNNSLSEVIKKVLLNIDNNLNIDIDVDRDSTLIYESYIVTRKIQSLKNTYPEIAKEWHSTKNGKITPEMVYPHSTKKVWWQCSKGHEWQTTISNRTSGHGCRICNHRKIVSGINDLLTQYPNLCEEWYYEKNDEIGLFPNKISFGTAKKAWWKCKTCGHIWQSAINSRVHGNGCPECWKKANFKPVICIETGIVYENLKTAAKKVGTHRISISCCCKGEQKTAGGYHWKYFDKK